MNPNHSEKPMTPRVAERLRIIDHHDDRLVTRRLE
jgi:hypothetical protein